MDKEKALRPVLIIGRIGRAHALQGEMRVESLTSDPGRFIDLKECLLFSADEKQSRPVQIASSRVAANQVYIRLDGHDTREKAETLRGCLLAVPRDQAVALPPDTWFICDLVGCAVYDEQEGYLGILTDVIQNQATDVYAVSLQGSPDLLFPARKAILNRVDIDGRRIDVRLPDGLFEVYRKRDI